jgi:two-component system sensor histidine kinase UhpB
MESATTDATQAEALLAAREEERSRIAQEIHDGPAQALANLLFQVGLVERLMTSDREAAERALAELRSELERQILELREVIHLLQPPLDLAQDLDEALRDAAAELAGHGRVVRLELDAVADDLTPHQRGVVLRVAQEALRNVARHAHAHQVVVATGRDAAAAGAAWWLEVRDDGRGLSDQEPASGERRHHFGLRFMRERAELIGAQLTIGPGADRGTTVRLTIPQAQRR